jgi:hypothetical protein
MEREPRVAASHVLCGVPITHAVVGAEASPHGLKHSPVLFFAAEERGAGWGPVTRFVTLHDYLLF